MFPALACLIKVEIKLVFLSPLKSIAHIENTKDVVLNSLQCKTCGESMGRGFNVNKKVKLLPFWHSPIKFSPEFLHMMSGTEQSARSKCQEVEFSSSIDSLFLFHKTLFHHLFSFLFYKFLGACSALIIYRFACLQKAEKQT